MHKVLHSNVVFASAGQQEAFQSPFSSPMQLSPDNLTPRSLSAEEESEPASPPLPDAQAISESDQNPLPATEIKDRPSSNPSYFTAWTSCQKQKEAISCPRDGALHESKHSLEAESSEQPYMAQSASQHQEFLRQRALHEDASEKSASRITSAAEESLPASGSSACEESPSMHTAKMQISGSESSMPDTAQMSGKTLVEVASDTEEGGSLCEDQDNCREPSTPLVTTPRCFQPASLPAASEVFQTPPSDCVAKSNCGERCWSAAAESEDDSSPLIPQSTVRRGSKRVVSSDDEEQPGNESSLPFLTAITCFDSTFSGPSCSTTGSGYAQVNILPLFVGLSLLRSSDGFEPCKRGSPMYTKESFSQKSGCD